MTDLADSILDFAAAHPVVIIATPGTVLLYLLIIKIHKRFRLGLLNPLLLTMLVLIAIILLAGVSYGEYQKGSAPLSFLAETAIVALALPLYQKWPIIKKYALPVVLSSVMSILISFLTAFILVKCFGLDYRYTATVAARSVTMPIAMDVAERLGGFPAITASVVCLAGIAGAVLGFPLLRLFRIRDSRAQGIAIGACSHAVGTSEAARHGITEGAFSSLGLILCGILTTLTCGFIWQGLLWLAGE
ncbi:LrgB family protein [Succinimonas amylolytica]|uniref:LrgB family protein n=1 Tax=Succinimonas amylolytica TaxID=83769 RepID=UPI000365C32B|nr:LrgB family protein [Succinimonas amylolytica]